MMMDTKKENDVPPQGVRTSQGTAGVLGLVPAQPLSTSSEGLAVKLPVELPTGSTEELVTVEEFKHVKKKYSAKEGKSDVPMDVDKVGATKRKKGKSSEEEEDKESKRPPPKVAPLKRRTIRDGDDVESIDGSQGCVTTVTSVIASSSDEDVGNTSFKSLVSSARDDQSEKEEKEEIEVVKRKVGRPKKRRQEALGLKEMGVKEINSDKEAEEELEYDNLTILTAGAQAIEYLTEVDVIRNKSKNIKGDLSGQMRRRLVKVTNIIKTIMKKSEVKGDVATLKRKNIELEAKLRLKEKEQKQREKDIEVYKCMVNELREDIVNLKEKVTRLENNEAKSSKNISRQKKDTYYNTKYLEKLTSAESEEERPLVLKSQTSPRRKSYDDSCIAKAGTSLEQKKEKVSKIKENWVKGKGKETKDWHELDWNDVEWNEDAGEDKEVWKDPGPEFPPLPQREPRELRPRIKVLENIQLRPPLAVDKILQMKERVSEKINREETDTENDWRVVEKRGKGMQKRKEEDRRENAGKKKNRDQDKQSKGLKGKEVQIEPVKKEIRGRRPPRTAAVTIKGRDENFSYANALKRAREEISLTELGIENTRIRKTVTGGILIQIPGRNGSEKAELLADKLQKLLENEARVVRPVIKGELRIIGMDDSITKDEIVKELAKQGNCEEKEVKLGDIKIMRNGLGFIWAQCPLSAAVQIARYGKIKLGWSIVKVELLKARPRQCYKCWQYGHLRQNCVSESDYSRLCYKCGEGGHWAKSCVRDPQCLPCKKASRDSNHRLGSILCTIERRKISSFNANGKNIKENQSKEGNLEKSKKQEEKRKEVDRKNMSPMDVVSYGD